MDFDSDYVVEDYVKPQKIRKRLVNDESADLLGNFDDKKRKEIEKNVNVNSATEENPFASDSDSEANTNDDEVDEELENDGEESEIDDKYDSDAEEIEEAATEELIAPPTSGVNENAKAKAKKKKKKKTPVAVDEKAPPNVAESGSISNQQIAALMKGASKQDRFVLYVTNLNYDTSKERLHEFFQKTGDVKSVRIPKNRKTAFAFVEMEDISGYKVSV